jgi:hypothetical protein
VPVSPPADAAAAQFGPWNPGIGSHVPGQLRHLATIVRPENVYTSLEKAEELRDLTGLPVSELVAFRPQRLALHELLIRVTADVSVPDGSKIEDLGINFREISGAILERYVEPRMDLLTASFEQAQRRLAALIAAELTVLPVTPAVVGDPAVRSPRSWLLGRITRRREIASAPTTAAAWDARLVNRWEVRAHASGDGLEKAACRALARVVSALLSHHGRVWGTSQLIASLATDLACNDFGSDAIGTAIEPLLRNAAHREGYNLLPRQDRPVVLNTKGASASGKSTLRPLQKTLAREMGLHWSDFALISPDIWRKQLLDYSALGAAYKYGGAFTGEELQIIDQKLDRYMARKADRDGMSHLLIDRFRFDSFAPDSDEAGSNLLTRFGHTIYLFFMITPPELLVQRAWKRGLEIGRYKAVDDTLAHGVEAYSGMPQLFFTWVQRADKRIHFEFLDNSVQLGERPRTVAFGWNDTLNLLDVKCVLDVERYRRINVDATAPEHLYRDPALLAPQHNTGFLRQCIDRFRQINFADAATGRIYLRIVSGSPVFADRETLDRAVSNPDTLAGVVATAPAALGGSVPEPERPILLSEIAGFDRAATLGRWGIVT